jgi:sensory rhodopsin
MDIQLVFLTGIGLFSFAAVYFLFTRNKLFNSAFLVSFITIISYILMHEGSLSSIGAGDGAVYATRWAFYALSCTLLMYEIAKLLGKKTEEILFLLYLTAIVMLTGAASAYYDGIYMIAFFLVSSIAYIRLIFPLLTADSKHRNAIAKYILLGWSGFPLVFLIAPDGFGLITATTAAAAYLVFDIFTKVIFYIDIDRRRITN